MTTNSKICKLIHDANGDEGLWKSELEFSHHGVQYKEEGDLAIFNYGIGADFFDPIVCEARGIIINTKNATVVCWPFTKFGKYDESYAANIDWNTARVQEQLDGSIIKLWWNEKDYQWQFSTNSVINAKDAYIIDPNNSLNKIPFINLIKSAENYNNIDFDILDRNKTYIFELVGPANKVIVQYDNYVLYHIGTRSNITGEESNDDIGIIKPKEFDLHNLDECINYVSTVFNTNNTSTISHCDNEGFVVVDSNWNRIKIKSPIYLIIHGILDNGKVSKTRLLDMLWKKSIDIPSLCKDFPKLSCVFKWYDYQFEKLCYDANAIIDISKQLKLRYDNDRAKIAKRIKDHYLSYIGFLAVDNPDITLEDILEKQGISRHMTKLIPDYPKTNFSYMLREED